MTDKIFRFITDENMLSPGDTVVCGLSGGADSVCLLLAMRELSERLSISVEALHVNHCLRGDESNRDEKFCRELCEKLNVNFTAVSCNVTSYAEENSLSTEEAARKLRYAIFAEHSAGKKLATAHNADDNLETVILNLARGSALKGIAGIPPIRGNIIRPLLTVSRREIETFLKVRGQSFVTDSTNLSDDYTRNKIRHRIVPLLAEINRSVTETSVRSISALRAENALIEELTDEAEARYRSGSSFTGLAEAQPVVRRRCIARLLSENNIPYSFDRLDTADGITVNGGKLNVSDDIYLVSDRHELSLKTIPSKKAQEYVEKELCIGENCIFPDKTLLCELIKCDDLKKIEDVNSLLTSCCLDYDKILGKAFVRSRIYGDRICLPGRDFSSSVKKLINEKVPPQSRNSMHFISDSEGTIFAEYIGVSKRAAPDSSTRRILRITVRNNF
jgi:tRNA(Ile)-lysidine synthase